MEIHLDYTVKKYLRFTFSEKDIYQFIHTLKRLLALMSITENAKQTMNQIKDNSKT